MFVDNTDNVMEFLALVVMAPMAFIVFAEAIMWIVKITGNNQD